MSGGTWTTQNKVRPGAYINFKSVPKPLSSIGTRGIVTMPVALGWGDVVTELYSTDLLDGTSIEKIGYDAFDEESLLFKEALKNAYMAVIYRLDTSGVKATKVITPLTVTAKYAGVCGNNISVAVVVSGTKFEVQTFYGTILKDKQTVTTIDELVDNKFVDFSGTGTPVAFAGTALTGGTNGTIAEGAYTAYLAEIQKHTYSTMAIPTVDPLIPPSILAFIKDQRDNQGKKVQAVVYNYPEADQEGIISVKAGQGYTSSTETITSATFVATVAGLTAGAEINQSLTNKEIQGAKTILGELSNADIITALNKGELILSKRQDGTIKIEQDINTFISTTPEKGYVFRKNRIIRCIDEINNTCKSIWEKSYMGKVDNNANGRNIYKAELIYYMNLLQSISAIQEFDGTKDITIEQGVDVDSVVVTLAVKPVDSMEKLYMTVSLSS